MKITTSSSTLKDQLSCTIKNDNRKMHLILKIHTKSKAQIYIFIHKIIYEHGFHKMNNRSPETDIRVQSED